MSVDTAELAIAFENSERIAMGALAEVALAVHELMARPGHGSVQVFDAHTSQPIDLELQGSADEVRARYEMKSSHSDLKEPQARQLDVPSTGETPPNRGVTPQRRPGRPRLGVVAREITLLPRHWEWLASQPGGASVTLRRLVDGARVAAVQTDAMRSARESTYRFMSAIAGNAPGFEEASRALFAGDAERFTQWTEEWPADVRDHARRLANDQFAAAGATSEAVVGAAV